MLLVKDCYGELKLNKYEILFFYRWICYKIQHIVEKSQKTEVKI